MCSGITRRHPSPTSHLGSTILAMISIMSGSASPITLWILYILAFFLPFGNAARQQPLGATTAPKRVAIIGKQLSMGPYGPYGLSIQWLSQS